MEKIRKYKVLKDNFLFTKDTVLVCKCETSTYWRFYCVEGIEVDMVYPMEGGAHITTSAPVIAARFVEDPANSEWFKEITSETHNF